MILEIGKLRSVKAVARVMREATVCSTCKEEFATGEESEQLCNQCRDHFFGGDE